MLDNYSETVTFLQGFSEISERFLRLSEDYRRFSDVFGRPLETRLDDRKSAI